jgi:hypothetical protein
MSTRYAREGTAARYFVPQLRRCRFYRDDHNGLWVPCRFIDLCQRDHAVAFWLAAACAYQQGVGEGQVWHANDTRWRADWSFSSRWVERSRRICGRFVDPTSAGYPAQRDWYLVDWDKLERAVARGVRIRRAA